MRTITRDPQEEQILKIILDAKIKYLLSNSNTSFEDIQETLNANIRNIEAFHIANHVRHMVSEVMAGIHEHYTIPTE